MSATTPPDFRSRDFLLGHIQHTMGFYHPRAVDPRGGFYHYFKDDGTIYDAVTRYLVSSTRFVFTYSMAYQHFHRQEYLDGMKHGVAFLRNVHRNPATGGYAWVLRFLEGKAKIEDAINHLSREVLVVDSSCEDYCANHRGVHVNRVAPPCA